ncbi:hypothetical protein BJY04DRAFT_220540 [Aspergillus karnatakaensis]|uniref:uncharacterized protein n=1 Tax=Aspergillus karnatakaensis TaxID=1810916 RepID=UPI003CCD4A3D
MPPLSAYTPFESLLFFQFLTTFDTRPTSFVSISDLLRNNKFVREHGSFDARRLSPEALEDLYSTLMRDGGAASSAEPNGHHQDSTSPSNPKKRKIASSRPDGLPDSGKSNPGLAPFLTSHLYAKYKELATKEIRHEEKRYREIQAEIEQLQRDEREAPPQKTVEPTPTPITQTKHEPAPGLMDVDTTEKPVERPQPVTEPKPALVELVPESGAKPSQAEAPRKDQPQLEPVPRPPIPVIPQTAPQQVQSQAQPVGQLSQPPTKSVPLEVESIPPSQPQTPAPVPPPTQQTPTPSRPTQHIPTLPAQPTQPVQVQAAQAQAAHPIQATQPTKPTQPAQPAQPQQLQPPTPSRPQQIQPGPQLPPQAQNSNGKVSQPPAVAPTNTPAQEKPANIPPVQVQQPLSTPVAVAPSPVPPRGPPISTGQPAPKTNIPVTTLAPPKAASTSKGPGKRGASATVPTAPPRGVPQASFQQWSLNQPQPSQPPQPSQLPQSPFPVSGAAGQTKPPLPPPSAQQTPKPEKKAQRAPQPTATPSTPLPTPPIFQTPAPPASTSRFATPDGPVQGFPAIGGRGSKPRLSIQTPGSLTPWKQTPHLTLPHSPRSPDRPRSEDVSPISERAPSPFGSREATPEDPEPPRRKGPGRGRKKASDAGQGASKKKTEKATGTAGKKRDKSAGSSRSRGRSIVSRDDESGAETGKIKREVPSTPARLDTAEPERSSTSQKGAPGPESRPGRGRPKRKRAPSDGPEPEPPSQTEIGQLNRIDSSDQSTPFVLCARNFPRTGAPIMNDVTMHKYASIFAKPLAERDAPGYPDLVYRPQDLKSIKSSIHQGSKALAAATEAANTPVADGESPVPGGTPSKNGVLMLQKTEDIIPPKAIVNSAQLEKELIRMFANAVMFNPVPQRGFGPHFPMEVDGGDGTRSYAPEPDEGGIIKDTLEMFEDVEKAVTRWRAAERRADELATKSVTSLRRGSASDPNMDSADDVKS